MGRNKIKIFRKEKTPNIVRSFSGEQNKTKQKKTNKTNKTKQNKELQGKQHLTTFNSLHKTIVKK